MTTSKEQGFTLLELMIVVAIIAILAAVGMNYWGETVKSSNVMVFANALRIAAQQARDDAIMTATPVTMAVNYNNYLGNGEALCSVTFSYQGTPPPGAPTPPSVSSTNTECNWSQFIYSFNRLPYPLTYLPSGIFADQYGDPTTLPIPVMALNDAQISSTVILHGGGNVTMPD